MTHTVKVCLKLAELLAQEHLLLFGKGGHTPVLFHGLQLFHIGYPGADGHKVGEHTAQPAMIDIRHATALGCGLNRLLCLLLGAHKEDGAALFRQLLDKAVCLVQLKKSLLEIDDVGAFASREDIGLHLGVPAAGLMSKVKVNIYQDLLAFVVQ